MTKYKAFKLFIPMTAVMLATPAMADWPVAVTDQFTVYQGHVITDLDLLANDIGSNLRVVDVNAWSENGGRLAHTLNFGLYSPVPNGAKSYQQHHVYGDVTYIPREDFVGQDAFWYVVEDDQGRRNAIRSIVNVVSSGFELPKPMEDFVDVPKNTSVRIDALRNDLFSKNLETFRGNITDFNTTTEQGGTVEKVEVYPRDRLFFFPLGDYTDLYTIENTLKYQFKYTPPAGFVGTDSFTYAIKDSLNLVGDQLNDTVKWTKVTLNVSEDNEIESPWPVAEPDEVTINITLTADVASNVPTEINVLLNDIGEDLVVSLDSNYSQEGARLTVNPNYPNRPLITYEPNYSTAEAGTSFEDKVWYVIEDKYGRKTFSSIDVTVNYWADLVIN